MEEEQITESVEANGNSQLIFDGSLWKPEHFIFEKVNFTGDLAAVLRKQVHPGSVAEGSIGDELQEVFNQLRPQTDEWKTAVALNDAGELLLQKTPAKGSEHEVSNPAKPPENSTNVFEVHNHPNSEGNPYRYFSSGDLVSFIYQSTNLAEAVVFDEGAAILIKTDKTMRKVQDQVGNDRWKWVEYGNALQKKWQTEVSQDSPEQRLEFTKRYAREYDMVLLAIPKGENRYKTLVPATRQGLPSKLKDKTTAAVAARLNRVRNLLKREK